MALSPRFLIISLITFFAPVTCAKSFLIPAVFVFGDSLADVGNNNNLSVPIQDKSNYGDYGIDLPIGLPVGRFSNGLNMADYAAKYIGFERSPPAYLSMTNVDQMLEGVNFASGGSGILDSTGPGTLTMTTQIKYFENVVKALEKKLGKWKAQQLISRSVFMIVTGSNDLFEYYRKTGAKDDATNDMFISNLVNTFTEKHLRALTELGAKNFLIAGLAPVGCAPIFRSETSSGDCADALNELAKSYNYLIKNKLHENLLSFRYSFIDSYGVFNTIMYTHYFYGITEIKTACCGKGRLNAESGCTANVTACEDRSNHLFWDRYHPSDTTTKVAAGIAFIGSAIYSSPLNLLQLCTGL